MIDFMNKSISLNLVKKNKKGSIHELDGYQMGVGYSSLMNTQSIMPVSENTLIINNCNLFKVIKPITSIYSERKVKA